jgi:hypothetical protein
LEENLDELADQLCVVRRKGEDIRNLELDFLLLVLHLNNIDIAEYPMTIQNSA